MREYLKFYIGGQWVDPARPGIMTVVNPATEQPCGSVAAGSATDVDRAVTAAREAFASWSLTGKEDRLAVLRSILAT